jgi:two-component system LytT family response regulator
MNAASPPLIRAVLVDDEQPARQHLRERLAAHSGIEVVGEADRVDSAAALIGTEKPDVVFLDVQMPGKTGFDLLPLLGELDSPPAVVFVTAYDKYAMKAFEVNALDYLTKPVSPRRLTLTVERLEKQRRGDSPPVTDTARKNVQDPSLEMRDFIMLRDKKTMRMVEAVEICAVEAKADYTRVDLAGGHTMLVRKSMTHWEQELPAPPFQKISRRLLLNIPRIKGIVTHDRESAEIQFEGTEKTVTVSRMELRRIRQAPE